VARVVALIPDLLFGSNVVGALGAAGHETVLVSDAGALARELPAAQLLIVDLTADADQRIKQVSSVRTSGIPVLAFYAHVEAEVRERAQEAGFDLVVPRSRMAREGAQLAARVLGG
jgi:CheY-like chemotaxis protein